jgi:outer membrane protein OmpA-like peptidoglycan-associated protein
MSRTLNVSKHFMTRLLAVALALPIMAAGLGSLDARGDGLYTSPKAIGEAQTILEQNDYLAPGRYNKGQLDRATIDAITEFQGAHTVRQTGALNYDTMVVLWSHAKTPRVAVATAAPLFADRNALILRGVKFDIDKATLRPESRTTLDRVTASLKDWPRVNVEIQGHTSEPGTDVHNMELSQRRAESVRTYLIAEGISPSRLVANGYGETRFMATNSTVEGRQKNRRVELHEID